MKVKICGITNIEDAMLCYNLGADAIGFVFYKKSKRYIKPDDAKIIIQQLPAFILKVGVFVNESPITINEIAKDTKLNVIQLHGEETPEDVYNIDLPVVKVFRVNDNFDYSILGRYKNCSILLDALDNSEYGGTGQKFNWNKIPHELKSKIILAGGVSIDNIKFIYENISPNAIDVSSSLELIPGKKDKQKVKLFFKKLNQLRNY